MMARRLVVAGGGPFARELINWAEQAADAGGGERIVGFLDRDSNVMDAYSYALEWRGDIDDYRPRKDEAVLVAIAEPAGKRSVVSRLRGVGATFATLVHPSAVIARTAVLGEGVVVCPHALVSADACVGDFVTVNALSSIGHDVRLGAYSTLSSHVDLTGFVQVGEEAFFGSGARVLPKLAIGARARVGAGATVVRSVEDDAVVYTIPAKKLT